MCLFSLKWIPIVLQHLNIGLAVDDSILHLISFCWIQCTFRIFIHILNIIILFKDFRIYVFNSRWVFFTDVYVSWKQSLKSPGKSCICCFFFFFCFFFSTFTSAGNCLRGLRTFGRVSPMFCKRDNFSTNPLLKGIHSERKQFSLLRRIFFLIQKTFF